MVRAIRNTHAPANRLPPEILSRILEHRDDEQDLVAATHVCQYWRSVLIFDSSLWTYFGSLLSLDRTLVYLERSKSAPIDINVIARTPQDFDALGYLASNIARTRSLSILTDNNVRPTLLHFCKPAPSLQHLGFDAVEGTLSIPENFLARQAPSLRSLTLISTRLEFNRFFPLPNLTVFDIYLAEGEEPFRMGALLQFFSDSPLLQKIRINAHVEMVQDISLDQITSLDSLVEIDYTSNQANSILPFLRMPHLKNLLVSSSVGPGQVQGPDDILPHDGRALLAQTTRMSHHSESDACLVRATFSGNEVEASFSVYYTTDEDAIGGFANWFSNQTAIPLGQIEELEIGDSPGVAGFHMDAFALENLKILRVGVWNGEFVEEILRPFHPAPQMGVPCQSLREVEYTNCWSNDGPFPASVISLAKERKQAGYQLRVFRLVVTPESYRNDLAEELREHVLEVQARACDGRT